MAGVVLLLLGLIGGGVFVLAKVFFHGSALLGPGVIAWEDEDSTPGSLQGQARNGPDVTTLCHKAGGDPAAHLIGGGFAIQGGSDPTLANPVNSSTSKTSPTWGWHLHLTNGHGTNYAICLREPAAFFAAAHALDYVASPVMAFNGVVNGGVLGNVAADATCPSGESILGGGYALGGAIQANEPVLVSSSYPSVDGHGARWQVIATTPSPYSGPRLQAFAICSGTMKTHLERTAMKVFPADPITFVAEGAASCRAGTLLSGGFHTTDGSGDVGLDVHIQTSAPGTSLKQNSVSGDTFTDWHVVLNGVSQASRARSVTDDTWVVCWDPPGQQARTTQTAQTTPGSSPTAITGLQPTNTTTASCQVVAAGSASLNHSLTYVNLDTTNGGPVSSTLQAGDAINWNWASPAGQHFERVNGARLHDLGTSANYGALDCAQLMGLSYGGGSVPSPNGEVFAVKTSNGHYAKVLVTFPTGAPGPELQWVTYQP